jgi:curli biogenesis system outer membrane secretion channel CsgG
MASDTGAIYAQTDSPPTVVAAPASPQKLLVVGALKTDAISGPGILLSPGAVANFRKSLITGLVKSRKFAVLDREFGDQVMAEKHPTPGDRSEAGRTNKLGEEATADYLATSSVKRCSAVTEERVMRISGRKIPMYNFALSVSVEVIDVASGRIVFADSIDEAGAGVVQGATPGFEGWVFAAMARSAERASTEILEAIYPLKIAAISGDGGVVLNEGTGRVDEGDEFEVFAVGERLKDPDTGVEIGRQETWAATIKVTRVLPKAAYAAVVKQAAARILVGAICRKPRNAGPAGQVNANESSVQTGAPAAKAGTDF